MKKKWSITDTTEGARTISDIESLSKQPAKKNFGCIKTPIFSSIPIDHIIIDTLHLFLRIADLLINLLIMELRRQDGIDKQRTLKLDRSKQTHIATYEKFLNEECKISFRWCADDQKLKWRDLTGPEKHRLFRKINIISLFPAIPKSSNIQELWTSFYDLMKMLTSISHECDANAFDQSAKTWVNNFCAVYQTKHVTPYAHALSMHVSRFLQLHGNISQFSEQGLEKVNDLTTKHYLRSTNHREKEALYQLIEKRNRLEYLEHKGCARKKRKCTCTSCGQLGHNKRKCLKEITNST